MSVRTATEWAERNAVLRGLRCAPVEVTGDVAGSEPVFAAGEIAFARVLGEFRFESGDDAPGVGH